MRVSNTRRMTTTMKVDLVGSSAPLGFFDPLGLSKGADAAKLNKYRESELKHGRVAMVSSSSFSSSILLLLYFYILISSHTTTLFVYTTSLPCLVG
jgi:hypothetical protein